MTPASEKRLLRQVGRQLGLPCEREQVAIHRAVVIADEATTRLGISRSDLFQEPRICLRRYLLSVRIGAVATFHVRCSPISGNPACRVPTCSFTHMMKRRAVSIVFFRLKMLACPHATRYPARA